MRAETDERQTHAEGVARIGLHAPREDRRASEPGDVPRVGRVRVAAPPSLLEPRDTAAGRPPGGASGPGQVRSYGTEVARLAVRRLSTVRGREGNERDPTV